MSMATDVTVARTAMAREYMPLQVQKIQAMTTLTPDIYNAELPEVFVRMLEEGRMKVRTHAMMYELLVPDKEDIFNAIQILVTKDMARDLRTWTLVSMGTPVI
jgi:hypothetical protein